MDPYLRRQPVVTRSLQVSNFNYAEVVKRNAYPQRPDAVMSYDVNFNFSVPSRSSSTLNTYDRVKVIVKRKGILGSIPNLPPTSLDSRPDQTQNFSLPILPDIVNSSNLNATLGLNLPTLPVQIEQRVFSGLQIVSDSNRSRKDNVTIFSREVSLLSSISSRITSYRVTDISKVSAGPSTFSNSTTTIDVKNLLPAVNREKVDPTHVTSISQVQNLTSPNDDWIIDFVSTSQNTLSNRLTKYYLADSPRRQDEADIDKYIKTETVKSLDYVDVTATIQLPFDLKDTPLEVRYEIYSVGSTVADETIVKSFDFGKHIEVFEAIQTPPDVYIDGQQDQMDISLVIIDKENRSKVTAYAVYVKDLNIDGTVGGYSFVQTFRRTSDSIGITFPRPARSRSTLGTLTCVRVVPIDVLGNESNVFTNVIVGKSHPYIGNMVLLADYSETGVKITVERIPPGTNSICLSVIPSEMPGEDINAPIFDQTSHVFDVNTSRYVDHVTFVAYSLSGNAPNPVSNAVTMKVRSSTSEAGMDRNNVSVVLSNLKTDPVNYDTSFEIKTQVKPEVNTSITNFISSSLPQLYEQLLRSSIQYPGGFGNPVYNKLTAHEVVRTNLSTGEREFFSIVSDGVFTDNNETRTASGGVKPIDPSNEYVYQVFTYAKNPISLMREYVLKVKPVDSKAYYYHPYKWKNSYIRQNGSMPPNDGDDLPIIDQYANLTSTPLGCIAKELRLYGNRDYISVKDVTVERIDRNTNKISWGFDVVNYSDRYDSFVVLKNVNGTRKILGRTRINYIYHELSQEDLGSVYYTVIPITSEFDIDDSAHSSVVVLRPEGLVPPVSTLTQV